MCVLGEYVDVGEEVLVHEGVVGFGVGAGEADVFILVVKSIGDFASSYAGRGCKLCTSYFQNSCI